jgi:hypothetical protein
VKTLREEGPKEARVLFLGLAQGKRRKEPMVFIHV